MKTRRFTYGLLAVAVVAVVTTAAATSGAAARSPAYTVDWAPCAGSPAAQCGTMEVPVDWSRPHGPKVHVAVARHPAGDPDHRIGTLYFNPGGPGDPSSRYVTQAEAVFPTELVARFDIVGLDPRATGNSVQVHCGVPVLTPQDTLYPRTERAFQAMVRHNRAVGLSCLRQTGPLMAHTDTVTLARDHEALRIALGVRTVTWLGISYGTQVAANYAELYPQRTRAMVLDAALEHSQPEGVQVADEIMSAEDAFNRFVAGATRRRPARCADKMWAPPSTASSPTRTRSRSRAHAWTMFRRSIRTPRCSNGSRWADNSLRTCRGRPRRGRSTAASGGLSRRRIHRDSWPYTVCPH
jgi:pimeloyl-ACP methyl ester carboxylesterase